MADTTTAPDSPVRRKPRATQRGRQLEPAALADLEVLLAGRPRARDSLIEHLHAIQDACGHLALRHLRALAHWMNLPMAAVYETATFYAHFDIVRDGEIPPPAVTIRVCDSLSCELAGARALQVALAAEVDPADIRVLRAPCMGRCDSAPVVEVGHRHLGHATPAAVRSLLQAGDLHPEAIAWQRLDAYRAEGGYALLDGVRAGDITGDALSTVLQDAGLRGLGGAGFPTFRKWAFVRAEPAPRYMVINADEGEPGTFKDRHYLEQSPHRFLEGALVSAWAVDAAALYIYLRDEYPGLHAVLHAAIAEVHLHQMITPYIYFMFILWLPFNMNRSMQMIIAFILGFTLDSFRHHPGFHTAACVLIAYIRPFLINLLIPQEGSDSNYEEPSIKSLGGMLPYLIYAGVLSFIHNGWLFLLEAWQFGDIWYFLIKTLLSTAICIMLILITELLFSRKQRFRTNTV